MLLSKLKFYLAVIGSITLVSVALFLFLKIHHHLSPQNGPSLPHQIHSATQAAQQAHAVAQQALQKVDSLKPLSSVVSVHTYITPDTLHTLQIREDTYLDAISKLKIEVEKQQDVINIQNKYIIQLKHTVIKWKVISGVLTAIIIKLLLFS